MFDSACGIGSRFGLQSIKLSRAVLSPDTCVSLSALSSVEWELLDKKVPQLKGNRKSEGCHWLKLEILTNNNSENLQLEIKNPNIDYVNFYVWEKNRFEEVETRYLSDSAHVFNYYSISYILPLNKLKPKDGTVYIRLKNEVAFDLPFFIGNAKEVSRNVIREYLIYGFYSGILIGLFLYNVFIFVSLKEKSYFYYLVHIIFVFLTQSVFFGFLQAIFNLESVFWRQDGFILFTCCVTCVGILFFRAFLNLPKNFPAGTKVLNIILVIYAVNITLIFLGFGVLVFQLIFPLQILVVFIIFSIALNAVRNRIPSSQIYLISWSVLLVGVVIFALKEFRILPYNFLTIHTIQIGSAVEAILLSMALANRINVLRKEKEENQEERIRLVKENERIILQQNRRLDSEVKNRTSELTKTNQNLEKTLKNLKEAQTQLVDSEKMASLGQLTAGIAHEINNPINFVTSNIKPLQRDVEDLYSIIDKFDTVESGKEIQGFKEIEDLKEELEYTYIREEIGSLLSGIADGANRTADIIKGLKTFSRLDEDVKKRTDIIEGMESTLIILNTKLKNKIGVVKEYQEGMPNVECFPGKLNQAFMNILNNAIYAIEHKSYPEGEDPTLTIKIERQESNAIISIGDNGIGMNEATRQKIFEPFYTTKDVGEGTGLGMSIVFNIIEKHNGKMELNSQEGIGTEFRIFLPM